MNPADCKGRVTLTAAGLLDTELLLEFSTPLASGDCVFIRLSGLLSDSGGELRAVPLLTWQVGHNLTNLEMSSFGTLCMRVSNDLLLSDPRFSVPGIDTPDLGRGLVPPSVLTLLVCFGENLEQLFSHCYRFAFMADLSVLEV